MMRKLFFQALVIFCLAAMCHAVTQSGDAGAGFAANMSTAKCGESNVSAVYICTGNVVKVVSSLPGAGSTFYRPDGMVVSCPVVAISQRSAECVQLTSPNICGNESVCKAQAPKTNVTQPVQPPVNTSAQANQSQPSQPKPQAPAPNGTTIVTQKKITAPDQSGILVLIILLAGMLGLAVLHYLYTKTKGEPL